MKEENRLHLGELINLLLDNRNKKPKDLAIPYLWKYLSSTFTFGGFKLTQFYHPALLNKRPASYLPLQVKTWNYSQKELQPWIDTRLKQEPMEEPCNSKNWLEWLQQSVIKTCLEQWQQKQAKPTQGSFRPGVQPIHQLCNRIDGIPWQMEEKPSIRSNKVKLHETYYLYSLHHLTCGYPNDLWPPQKSTQFYSIF